MDLDPRSKIDDEENPHYAADDDEEEDEDELEDDDEIVEADVDEADLDEDETTTMTTSTRTISTRTRTTTETPASVLPYSDVAGLRPPFAGWMPSGAGFGRLREGDQRITLGPRSDSGSSTVAGRRQDRPHDTSQTGR